MLLLYNYGNFEVNYIFTALHHSFKTFRFSDIWNNNFWEKIALLYFYTSQQKHFKIFALIFQNTYIKTTIKITQNRLDINVYIRFDRLDSTNSSVGLFLRYTRGNLN